MCTKGKTLNTFSGREAEYAHTSLKQNGDLGFRWFVTTTNYKQSKETETPLADVVKAPGHGFMSKVKMLNTAWFWIKLRLSMWKSESQGRFANQSYIMCLKRRSKATKVCAGLRNGTCTVSDSVSLSPRPLPGRRIAKSTLILDPVFSPFKDDCEGTSRRYDPQTPASTPWQHLTARLPAPTGRVRPGEPAATGTRAVGWLSAVTNSLKRFRCRQRWKAKGPTAVPGSPPPSGAESAAENRKWREARGIPGSADGDRRGGNADAPRESPLPGRDSRALPPSCRCPGQGSRRRCCAACPAWLSCPLCSSAGPRLPSSSPIWSPCWRGTSSPSSPTSGEAEARGSGRGAGFVCDHGLCPEGLPGGSVGSPGEERQWRRGLPVTGGHVGHSRHPAHFPQLWEPLHTDAGDTMERTWKFFAAVNAGLILEKLHDYLVEVWFCLYNSRSRPKCTSGPKVLWWLLQYTHPHKHAFFIFHYMPNGFKRLPERCLTSLFYNLFHLSAILCKSYFVHGLCLTFKSKLWNLN